MFIQPREVGGEEIESLCDLKSAMESQSRVFRNFHEGSAYLAPRAVLSQGNNAQFAYLARASEEGPTIVKYGTVFPDNAKLGKPVVQTSIISLSPLDGSVEYVFDGEAVTKLRTVAASMVAIQALLSPSVKVDQVGVVGLGHQGIAHADAIRQLFPSARIIGISSRIASHPSFDVVTTDIESLKECQIIILATSSSQPVLHRVTPGSTVISIGSFAPNRSEVSLDVMKAANHIVVDDLATASTQCGAIVNAGTETIVPIKTLGSILAQRSFSREPNDVAIYFSVGLGIQDAALIEHLLSRIA